MKKPYISVIIPAYNEEKYIDLCLKSLTIQSFRYPYEIIVANNNSTDSTIAICKKYNVRIVNEVKKGYAQAAISAIKKATSPIIAMTDADTQVPFYWLEKIYSVYQDSSVVAVGGGFEYYDGPFIVKSFLKLLNRIHPKLIVSSLSGMNMSFRKDIYDQIGGHSPKINLQADTYLGNQLYKKGRVIILKDNNVKSSARRLRSTYQIIYELLIRVSNALHLKFFNTTIHKDQVDYR